MILLCVTLHRVCYPNSNCVQDYMTPEQYQILFFSYEQFKQLNFYREGSPRVVSFVVVVDNLIVLSVILSSDEYRTGKSCFIVTQDTLLVTKHRWDCTNFCGCKHCPNHAHHIVRYILQIFFFLLVYLLFSCIKNMNIT